MATAGILRGNRGNWDRIHGNPQGRGQRVTSHGVTVGMGSNADGNTAVKWKRDEQCCLVTILALLDCRLCSLWSEMDQKPFLLVNALILNSLVNQSCHCHLCIWVSVCLLSGSKSKLSLLLCIIWNVFFRSFNSVYQKCCRANRETVVLQLVNSYCKPHLLYATECLQLSHTAMKKLKSAWLCALSKNILC